MALRRLEPGGLWEGPRGEGTQQWQWLRTGWGSLLVELGAVAAWRPVALQQSEEVEEVHGRGAGAQQPWRL